MNNKGFTLIELLATMTLLAILMLIAVPNVIGIVNRNKNKTYIEDAKKMVSLAEYKVRADVSKKPTVSNKKIRLALKDLGKEELKSAPNGGCYDLNDSYVDVTYTATGLKYRVRLVERKGSTNEDCTGGTIKAGIPETDSADLYEDSATSVVKNSPSSFESDKTDPPIIQTDIVPKYYEFGNPTTSSTTDCSFVSSRGVFNTLYSDNKTRGVCVLINNKQSCFRYNNDYTEENNQFTRVFSCNDTGNALECNGNGFRCTISEERIFCLNSSGSGCDVTKSGEAKCGD